MPHPCYNTSTLKIMDFDKSISIVTSPHIPGNRARHINKACYCGILARPVFKDKILDEQGLRFV